VDFRNDDVGLGEELRSRFKNFFGLPSEDFYNLVCLVVQAVNKKNANFRNAISVN